MNDTQKLLAEAERIATMYQNPYYLGAEPVEMAHQVLILSEAFLILRAGFSACHKPNAQEKAE